MGLRISRLAVGFAAMMGAMAPAHAAELKISLAELARILSVAAGEPKLRLHNVPGGVLSLAAGSSLTLGSTSVPIPVPARSFVSGGTTYAYYINDLDSKKITISAVPGALRFTILFEDAGPEMIGKCISGVCLGDSLLPVIQWNSPSVTIDLAPVATAKGLSLVAKKVDVGGSFAPDCTAATGIFSGSLCKIVLPQARKSTANLKADLNTSLMTQFNSAEMQAKLSGSLRSYLKFGPAGDVQFSKVAVDQTNVTLTFCLACQTQ